ncbi:antigen 5 like allergen Cul n 1-like [Musca vetustissima]|uniref:antigen 5 like allergen Cul n 1-like n=1 Tax=Musca vetustissima TaxID=27455 RepID=UPI002AB69A69|nr:antigen 5 like allergen Cul n 1-like [Musca vetustissima]
MISNEFKGHVPITKKMKRIFMHIHNDYRNRVASGKEIGATSEKHFPKASRMRELIWDNELMYVAHIHTAQTRMGHDKCRATQRFLFAGQNLGWKGTVCSIPIIEMLNESLHEMYMEKDVVPDPVAMADLYNAQVKNAHVGHFTAMMNDRTSRLGCAISIGLNCKAPNVDKVYPWCYYLACNYDGTNLLGSYIYKTDAEQSASQCSDWGVGKSSVYEHLCGNSGEIFDPTKMP